ncbi:hypothetical protein H5410_051085 [Solanum commersonii]|uniref:Uncharacterized protein n=1 Tax=Solanum commersonii TaxID=4109 RepID=A0A9J5WXF1_SOLCO|nr:hypothetical protein H5410_051085 [Solanum commersonii]
MDRNSLRSKPKFIRIGRPNFSSPSPSFSPFFPLMETVTGIFERLWAKGLLRPRKGWIPRIVHIFNIFNVDTKECSTLRNTIQNMIEKGKIIVQQGPLNHSTMNASLFKEFPHEYIQGT